jgi:hypothetical protein
MSVSRLQTLGLTALAAFACTGVMQAAEQGTFHLPMEAHWGQTVLEPGDYTIIQPTVSFDSMPLRVVGGEKSVFEPSHLAEFRQYSDSSYLKLTTVDGEYFVTEFSSGATGKTFRFDIPKSVRRHLATRRVDGTLALAVK